MKFHLLAGGLLAAIIALLYFMLTGFSDDLSEARTTIEKESFKTAQTQKKKARTDPKPDIWSQKVLSDKIPEEPPPPPPPVQKKETAAVPNSVDFTSRLEGRDYWCRSTIVTKDKNPVRCEYPDSCYSCENSDIIPPEVNSAVPFCKDGSRPQMYSVECCPTGTDGKDIFCPSIDECMQAENVPENFCTCNNQLNCKYVVIGSKVECACVD